MLLSGLLSGFPVMKVPISITIWIPIKVPTTDLRMVTARALWV